MDKYIKLPFIMNIMGSCGGGKSYFIQYLIKSLKTQFDCILIFSNTANFTEDYNFLKELNIKHFIFSSLDADDKAKKIMDIQKKNRLNDNVKSVLLVYDDIFGTIKDSKIFKNLVSTFRHYRISIIFSAQYVSASASYLREISNYIIIFNQRTHSALKLCYENYFADEFERYTDFKNNFVNKLLDHHFYYINRVNGEKKIMVCPSKL